MLQYAQQTSLQANLNNPETRRILTAYDAARKARFDIEVYIPLGKRYPSLKRGFSSTKIDDPVESVKDLEKRIEGFRGVIPLLEFAELMLIAAEPDNPRRVQKLSDKVNDTIQTYTEYKSGELQFYAELAESISHVSSEAGLPQEEAVESIPLMDKAFRHVIPERNIAEARAELNSGMVEQIYDVIRTYIHVMNHIGIQNEDVETTKRMLPTQRASKALKRKSSEFSRREFDRIYSGNV